jgi:hypothetical protein
MTLLSAPVYLPVKRDFLNKDPSSDRYRCLLWHLALDNDPVKTTVVLLFVQVTIIPTLFHISK